MWRQTAGKEAHQARRSAAATLQVNCLLFFSHVISEIPLKGTHSFFVLIRINFKYQDLKEVVYRNQILL